MTDTLDRAKAYSGDLYKVLLAVQHVAETTANFKLIELRVGVITGDETLTVEAKR